MTLTIDYLLSPSIAPLFSVTDCRCHSSSSGIFKGITPFKMNQQIEGANAFSSGELPMKRKRGRPRKDGSLVKGESIQTVAGSESVKKSRLSLGSGDGVDKMVGQVVSGVIEGSFDDGYLLNVKVGDTDTELRGVVFLPGHFTPVNPTNDVAPLVPMYKRKEMPIPTLNPHPQPSGSAHPENSNKQSAEVKNQAPKFPDRSQHSQFQPVVLVAPEPVSERRPDIETSTVVKGPNEVGTKRSSEVEPSLAPVSEILPGTETSIQVKGLDNVKGNKKSKVVHTPPPAIISQGIEAVGEKSKNQDQVLSSDTRKSYLQGEMKIPNFELNQPPPTVLSKSEKKSVNNGYGEGVLQGTES
ncbi:hypothetical protein G4B88_022698 [Cannabis sativa]|uniref:AT hook motif-containing protein n=1 Tax=Cannabis sativa TaxID=3483 RepID=A0A7J6HX87_CANSA|nr:hypothetical protein G4B88_022698 [Cannabis sativa]